MEITNEIGEKEIIVLPYCFKTNSYLYCIISENMAIRVNVELSAVETIDSRLGIDSVLAFKQETITPAEFKEAFETTLETLTAMLPE